MPSASTSRSRSRARRSLASHSSRMSSQVRPVTVSAADVQEPEASEVQHHLGNAAGEEHADRRVVVRTVRQRVDESGDGAVDTAPVVDRRPAETGRVRDRRNVDAAGSSIRRTRRGRASRSRSPPSVSTSASVRPSLPLVVDGLRGSAGDVEPDRLSRRRERGVRHGQPERLGDDLRRRGGAEELAAAAGRRARAAAELGGLLERDETVREARSERLHGAGVLAAARRQRHTAGDDGSGEVAERGDRHQSSPADPCRRCRRRSRPAGSAGCGRAGAARARRRCGTAASRTCPACPASARRTDPRRGRRTADRRGGRAPPPPRGRAGRPPSGRCGSRARSACRRRRAPRPASRGSGTGRVRPSTPPSPCPAFCDSPKTSPDGLLAEELRRERESALTGPAAGGLDVEEVALVHRPAPGRQL